MLPAMRLAATMLFVALTACATPVVMLKNEATGQVVRCGGGVTGSIAGGLIGHSIEKSYDEDCVRDFEARGFRRTSTASTPAADLAAVPASAPAMKFTGGARAPAPPTSGQDSWSAERLPAAKACSTEPRAVFTGKGPGFESYTLACSDGDQLMIRCEFGNCRVLR